MSTPKIETGSRQADGSEWGDWDANPDPYRVYYWILDQSDAWGASSLFENLDIWYHKISYLRVNSIRLGYTFPEEWTKRFQIERLKVFASIRNVAVWAMDGKLKYYGDPENLGTANRTYSLGLNMVF